MVNELVILLGNSRTHADQSEAVVQFAAAVLLAAVAQPAAVAPLASVPSSLGSKVPVVNVLPPIPHVEPSPSIVAQWASRYSLVGMAGAIAAGAIGMAWYYYHQYYNYKDR